LRIAVSLSVRILQTQGVLQFGRGTKMGELVTSYALQIALGIVALFAVWKDWRGYKERSQKWGKPAQVLLLIAIIVLLPLSLMDTHYRRKGDYETKERLNTQIENLRDDNKASAKEFASSFSTLYGKFSDLQAKVETGQLLKIDPNLAKEIGETKKELAQAEAKLNQPKAVLVASFPVDFLTQVPISSISIPRSSPISVTLNIVNTSDVNALNGYVTVEICRGCKFHSEPKNTKPVAGQSPLQRNIEFQHIFGKTALAAITLDIDTPLDGSTSVEISVTSVCETCGVSPTQDLWVHLI
jgi:hypothetical protein